MDYRRNAMRNVRPSERCGVPCVFGENIRERDSDCDLHSGCDKVKDCDDVRRIACAQEEDDCDCDVKVLDTNLVGAPLAMVYSPFQRFDNLFEPEEALCHGTLFMELFKPFYGSRRGV